MLRDTLSLLNNKRLLARLRSEYPLLFILPAFLFGQIVVPLDAYSLKLRLFLLLFLLITLFKLGFRSAQTAYLLLFMLAGMLSQHLNLPGASDTKLLEQGVFLVQVQEIPRRRRTDEVLLSLRILENLAKQQPSLDSQRLLCRAVDLPWKNLSRVELGDRLVIKARFSALKKLPHIFSYESHLLRAGYSARCKIIYASPPLRSNPTRLSELRAALIQRITLLLGDDESSGLILSLAFGVRDLLSNSSEESFKRTGLAHLLVFSGYQVVLFFHFMGLLCRFSLCLIGIFFEQVLLRISARISLHKLISIAAWLSSMGLVWLSGTEPSTLRAALALSFYVCAQLFERGHSFLNSILFSMLLMLALAPACLLEPGVQLSYAALLGINLAKHSAFERSLQAYLRTNLYVWFCTTFCLLCWFGRISLLALPLNLIFAPLISFLGCNLSILAIAVHLTGIDSNAYLLRALSYMLDMLKQLVIKIAAWPYISLDLFSWLLYVVLFLIGMFLLSVIAQRLKEFSA